MAASSPTVGDRSFQPFRRSLSIPHRELSLHERAGLDRSDADAQVYYTHPAVHIYSFSPPVDPAVLAAAPNLPDTDYPVDAIGTLPWRSRTEILAAQGQMVIEKVRGSTKFLKCGPVNQAIMRNSQSWCVDGESKFVFRTGHLKYNRLELPTTTETDKQKVEELKTALASLMRFENTPCPFQRGFHVDLPDDAITPRRKGTWKRRESQTPATPDTDPQREPRREWAYQKRSATAPVLSDRLRHGSESSAASSRDPSPQRGDGSRGGRTRSATPSSLASEESYERRLSSVGLETGVHEGQTDGQSSHRSEIDSRPVSQSGETARSKVKGMIQRFNIEPVPQLPKQRQPRTPPEPAVRRSPPMEVTETAIQKHEEPDASSDTAPGTLNISQEVPTVHEVSIMHESDQSDVLDEDVALIPELPPAETVGQGSPADIVTERGEQPPEGGMLTDATAQEDSNQSTTADEAVHAEVIIPDVLSSSHVTESEPAIMPGSEVQSTEDETLSSSTNAIHTTMQASDGGLQLESTIAAINNALRQVHQAESTVLQSPDEKQLSESTEAVSDFNHSQTAPLSRVSSRDSFRSANSAEFKSPLKSAVSTPVDSQFPNRTSHSRGVSEATVKASTINDNLHDFTTEPSDPNNTSTTTKSSLPSTTTAVSNHSEIQDNLRRRRASIIPPQQTTVPPQRSFSPLPSSSNIFWPTTSIQSSLINPAILQKAAHLALVKPVELVYLVFHILSKIASGATVNDLLSGELFRRTDSSKPHRRSSSFPDHLQTGPHSKGDELDDFDFEDDEFDDEHEEDDGIETKVGRLEEEDDFGVPIRGHARQGSLVSRSAAARAGESIFDLD